MHWGQLSDLPDAKSFSAINRRQGASLLPLNPHLGSGITTEIPGVTRRIYF